MEELLALMQTLASQCANPVTEKTFQQQVSSLDLDKVLLELVQGFSQFLNQEFRERRFSETAQHLTIVKEFLGEWEALPRKDRFTKLEAIQTGVQGVVCDLQTKNPLVALGPFLLAGSLHLHLLYLRYRLFQSELSPLRAHANLYGKHIMALLAELQTQASLRFTIEPVPDGPAGQCEYRIDGKLVATMADPEVHEKRYQDIAAATGPVVERLTQLAREWRGAMVEDSIRQGFCRTLERPVDEESLVAYNNAFRDGLLERNLVRDLVLSDEHQLHFVTMHSPVETLHVIFDHVLARWPDQQEMSTYKTVLARRGGKAVIEDLLDGTEYEQRFGDYKIPGNGRAGCF